jgi:hypothetical protein
MAGPLTTEPFAPRLASKTCGWDGVEGDAGFFFVFAMRSPGPASRQPLIVSNRPHRLTLVRADLHENPNRSAKEESVGAGFQCQLLPRSQVPL